MNLKVVVDHAGITQHINLEYIVFITDYGDEELQIHMNVGEPIQIKGQEAVGRARKILDLTRVDESFLQAKRHIEASDVEDEGYSISEFD